MDLWTWRNARGGRVRTGRNRTVRWNRPRRRAEPLRRAGQRRAGFAARPGAKAIARRHPIPPRRARQTFRSRRTSAPGGFPRQGAPSGGFPRQGRRPYPGKFTPRQVGFRACGTSLVRRFRPRRSPAWSNAQACAAVMATVATMSSTEQPRERSLQGLAMPWRMGP